MRVTLRSEDHSPLLLITRESELEHASVPGVPHSVRM
jgi:hypothetical protein